MGPRLHAPEAQIIFFRIFSSLWVRQVHFSRPALTPKDFQFSQIDLLSWQRLPESESRFSAPDWWSALGKNSGDTSALCDAQDLLPNSRQIFYSPPLSVCIRLLPSLLVPFVLEDGLRTNTRYFCKNMTSMAIIACKLQKFSALKHPLKLKSMLNVSSNKIWKQIP